MFTTNLTPEQRLDKAVIDIMAKPELIALSGVMMIGKREIREGVPTACTNGRDEFYGRAFVDKLSDAELRFLVLHEVYHKLYKHLTTWRWMYDEHPKMANVACVVGETHVTMADGSVRRAENIRVGDMVATPFGPSPVLAVRVTDDREVCELDMHMGNKLVCTPDHKILTERGYVEAQDLTETDTAYVDTRDGGPATREARHHADQGHRTFAWGNAAGGVREAQDSRTVRISDDREEALSEQLGLLVAYGLGVLRRLGRRGGHSDLPAYTGQVPAAHDVCYEHQLQLDALVGVAGDVLRAVAQQRRQHVLESGGQRVRHSSGAGGYPPVGQDSHSQVRHPDGDYQDQARAWLSVPADTAHHELVGGAEGFEPARVTARRFLGARRRVYDITTAAQCFVAEGVVVHNCDFVINVQITDELGKGDWVKMPEGGCYDDKYRGWDAAQVFRDLQKRFPPQEGGSGGQGRGMPSGIPEGFDEHDWDGAQEMTEQEKQDLAREIDEALRAGVLAAGKTGSGGDRSFEELLAPQVDWREVLREFIQTTCAGKDYSTWKKPNRRYMGAGYYMPSGISEQIGEIVVAIDTSGSIGNRELSVMLSEVKEIADTVHPEAVRLLYWDTEVCADECYEGDSMANIAQSTKPAGGGGTMVECVPQYLQDKQIKAQCVIILTDGYLGGTWGNWHHETLWVILDNDRTTSPVGKTVHVKARDL